MTARRDNDATIIAAAITGLPQEAAALMTWFGSEIGLGIPRGGRLWS